MHKISKKNHYERLSVPRDASSSLIAKAYREIAAVYHPDSGLYAEDNGQKLSDSHLEIFKLITESYNVLRDEDRRRAYDKSLPKDYKDDTWTDLSKSTSAQNNAQKNTRKSGKLIS